MSWFNIVSMLGGLGIFLFGMKIMGDGLELAAGNKLKKMLEVLTANKFLAILMGALVTAIIQSSSATTVMVVGFVNAGLLSLAQTVGIIMGANIGTTITGFIIALDLGEIAPLAVFLGVVLVVFIKNKKANPFGTILIGFGLLFIGLSTISSAMKPLREYQPFLDFMVEFQENPLMCLLIGLVVTAVIQSSSASVGILQLLVAQQLIGIKGAIFILCGQNIGTCITAIISSIGTSKTAKRTAIIHLLFNVIGSAIFILIALFTPFSNLIELITDDPQGQVASAHFIFNIMSTIILLPFGGLLVKAACKIIPGEDPKKEPVALNFLDDRILTTPSIAVSQVFKEVQRMAELARNNIDLATKTIRTKNVHDIETVRQTEEVINFLNHNITEYLVKINTLDLQSDDFEKIGSLFHVVNDLERIGDHADNIVKDIEDCINKSLTLSDDALKEIDEITEKALFVLDNAIEMFEKQDFDLAQTEKIFSVEEKIDQSVEHCKKKHVKRLNDRVCTPESGMIFINLLSNLERVSDHATNIAYAVEVR